jgi:hypothetical protein
VEAGASTNQPLVWPPDLPVQHASSGDQQHSAPTRGAKPESLVAGILIPVVPRTPSCSVAVYLIVVGILGLFGDIRLLGEKIDDE